MDELLNKFSHLATKEDGKDIGHGLQEIKADIQKLNVLFLIKLDCPMLLSQADFRIPSTKTRSCRDLFNRRHYQRCYDFHGSLARLMRLGNSFCDTFDIFNDSAATIRRCVLTAPHYTVE
ncbi:hypothetical protein J6590_077763 [Homalodisca vitripennis]|nr:hypothetical protein J6590_077763 [Homalodisca vitripennis]